MRILLIGCEVIIRELQLAKGAVAAGFRLLSDGCQLDPSRISVAGTFGNYVRGSIAHRIGLLPSWADTAIAGNMALRGARMLLLTAARR